jgi:hypothetical protein
MILKKKSQAESSSFEIWTSYRVCAWTLSHRASKKIKTMLQLLALVCFLFLCHGIENDAALGDIEIKTTAFTIRVDGLSCLATTTTADGVASNRVPFLYM